MNYQGGFNNNWNATAIDYPSELCVHELFEAQAARRPAATALVHEEASLSYGELDAQANRLARHLVELGVGPDIRVAICVERSPEMVVGVLAILKAGGAYVPLDPSYPTERLAFMVGDSAPLMVLTHGPARAALDAAVSNLAEAPALIDVKADIGLWADQPATSPDARALGLTSGHLAYVIYTSGSTGMPKGVMIEHRGFLNLALAQSDAFGTDESSQVLQYASLSFDASASELAMTFIRGGTLHLSNSRSILAGAALAQLLEARGITHATLPPSVLAGLPSDGDLSALRSLIVAGEAPSPALCRKWSIDREFFNAYGPTEVTVCATIQLFEPDDAHLATVPIGRPIANTRIYLLDDEGSPVPHGAVGEIYVGGAGVARGYLNRPELTAQRFIASPFVSGDRLYRTGDLARYLPDGNIEFLGRNDHQVKIRGFRIELGEIEARLTEHPSVREVAVLAREDVAGDKRLVAYVVYTERTPGNQVAALRRHLAERLPEYMVPAAYVALQALPLTPNGKLDRNALPPPHDDAYARQDYEPPRDAMEQTLAGIWADLLGVERVGRNDNFFALGGQSLTAIKLISRLQEEIGKTISTKALFDSASLGELAAAIHAGSGPVAALDWNRALHANDEAPLSYQQTAIWFLSKLHPNSRAYNSQFLLRFEGHVDVETLRLSLRDVVDANDIYRTTYHEGADGIPFQRVEPPFDVTLRVLDYSGPQSEALLAALLDREVTRIFRFSELPLVRWIFVKLGPTSSVLFHMESHLVHDGWSSNLFLQRLLDAYRFRAIGGTQPVLGPADHYGDYARWQRSAAAQSRFGEHLTYWKSKLEGAPLDLPALSGKARPAAQSFEGRRIRVELPASFAGELKAFCKARGVTLFTALLSAFQVLIHKYSGMPDFLIGSAVGNRKTRAAEDVLGMFVNMVALRARIDDRASFDRLLSDVRETLFEASDHDDLPFELLVRELQPDRTMASNPLFQIMFSAHDTAVPELTGPEFEASIVEGYDNQTSKFDLDVIAIPRGPEHENPDGITLLWTYSTELYDPRFISNLSEKYLSIMRQCMADPGMTIRDVDVLSVAERTLLLEGWNATAVDYPSERCIHELFEAQAAQRPQATALVYQGASLSYGELNARANRLARHLVGLGVGPDIRVAICVERSLEMVVGLLAILKAGGAYVPLDPNYPRERLAFMLGDSAPRLALTHGPARAALDAALSGLPEAPALIDMEADSDLWSVQPATSPDVRALGLTSGHLAYLIYTSGSTGLPKGVMIEHRNVTNLIVWANAAFEATELQRTLFSTSLNFDLSAFECFVPLCSGHSVQLVGRVLDLDEGAAVTLINTVPSAITALMDQAAVSREVRTINLAGEVLKQPLAERIFASSGIDSLCNLYGPSETTTYSTWARMTRESGFVGHIGRPIANTRIYLLDNGGLLVPPGAIGEIHIGGAGVARGYLNRPELTAERFIASPFVPGDRLYRTGDLARYLPDGNIEFLGRNDHQVKIRGFRIELGEIEARLAEHPSVREAAVMAREDVAGDQRLVAYVVHAQKAPVDPGNQIAALRRHLAERLPEYMVPAAYVALQALPLTPNGKLDRKALPPPEDDAYARQDYEAPRDETEQTLAAIWADLLGLPHVGVHDNLFDLGCHSLLATQLVVETRKQFGVAVPLRQLFATPTVFGLARFIEDELTVSASS